MIQELFGQTLRLELDLLAVHFTFPTPLSSMTDAETRQSFRLRYIKI
jgi:hypothetical protein